MTPSADDWELWLAWCGGDERSGQALVKRYFGLLMRLFRNKVRDPDDAKDLVSETMLRCIARRDQLEPSGSFRSYLFAVAMNALRGYYRKAAKRSRELDDFADVCVGHADGPASPGTILTRQREVQLLVRALRRLSLDQQIVVELSYFEGLGGREIAELLGAPEQTIYSRLRRGKQRLPQIIETLTTDPQLLQSTVVGLETWAVEIRSRIER